MRVQATGRDAGRMNLAGPSPMAMAQHESFIPAIMNCRESKSGNTGVVPVVAVS